MAKLDKTELFEKTPVFRAILALAVPTVLSQLITVLYNMADTFFVGQLNDPNQVAASTIAMPVFMMLTGIANLFGIGGASLISRSLGKGDKDRAKKTASFSIFTAIMVALVYSVLVLFLRPVLLPKLGTDEFTYKFTSNYLFWTVYIGGIPTALSMTLAHLVRAEGYSKHASIGIALGGILNIGLDALFILVFHMQIKGAAIATFLSNLVAVLYFFIIILSRRKTTVVLPNPKIYPLKSGIPKEVVLVGLTSFIMAIMGTVSNMVLNGIMASYSNEAIAGMGIAKRIDLIAYAIAHGMTQGVLPLIAYNYASGNKKRMTDSIKKTTLLTLGISLIATVVLYFGATPLSRLFIENDETVNYCNTFLKIIAIACPVTAVNCIAISVFQAMGKKYQPLILSMSRKGVTDIPFMFILSLSVGVLGIPWAVPIAEGIGLIFTVIFTILLFKQLKKQSN